MKLIQYQSTTQEHLEIEDIRDDLVILKTGQVSLVIETTAVNFDLLAEIEQESKILAFASLINSLTFYIQILIRTERRDMTSYIERLERELQRTKAAGLAKQMEIYINFIKNMSFNTEVLDKRFFVVVSSGSGAAVRTSFLKKLFGKEDRITNLAAILNEAKIKLLPRRDHIIKQLQKMNVFGRQLTTDELIKLFYSAYNPDVQGMKKLQIKSSELSAATVTGVKSQQ